MNLPNGSSPVRVITAARRPYLAAATATLVALPPSHLPKVWTSSSPTPTCSGYRSALTRPIVRTSGALTSAPRGAGRAGTEPRRGRNRAARLRVSRASTLLPGGFRLVPGGPVGYCRFTPVLLAGQEYVQTYLRNDLTTARLSGVIMVRTAEVAAGGRGSHEPCRPSHPGGPEQPGPALLPGGAAPGAPDRVR